MKLLVIAAAAASLQSASPFAPISRRKLSLDVPAERLSLLQFHFRFHAVNEKNSNDNNSDALVTASKRDHNLSSTLQHRPPFLALLEAEDSWKEWHYSFSRNGLTDFLPQFSDHIKCCMIGNDTTEKVMSSAGAAISRAFEPKRLPWQVDSEATSSITNLLGNTSSEITRRDSEGNQDTAAGRKHKHDHLVGQIGHIVSNAAASITEADETGFDCILDGGVLDAVVSSIPSTVTWHSRDGPAALLSLHSLMQEANQAIREFGIYVAITNEPVPSHAKEYLSAMGEVMGLEWTFDLDGLSNDDYCVSVARKYFTGAVNLDENYMPSPPSENGERHLLKP